MKKVTKILSSVALTAGMIGLLNTQALAAIGYSDEKFDYTQEQGAITATVSKNVSFAKRNGNFIYEDYLRNGNVELKGPEKLDMQYDNHIVEEAIQHGMKYIAMGTDLEGNEYTKLCVGIPFKNDYIVLYDIINGGTVSIEKRDLSSYALASEFGYTNYASEALSQTSYANAADLVYAIDPSLTMGKIPYEIMSLIGDGIISFDNMRLVVGFESTELNAPSIVK